MLNRRWFVASILALLLPITACAESDKGFTEGKDYLALATPVRTADPDKIEVTEVFWYGCSHCFHFEPMIHAWAQKLPADVDFERSPAMWNDLMKTHARVFYAAKALGVLEKVHQPIFDAINLERNFLKDKASIATFFEKHGVSGDKFLKAYDSFAVDSQVRQADARARGYQVSGTPEMIVDGKYRITTRTAGGQREMLKVAEYLIEKERAKRAAAK